MCMVDEVTYWKETIAGRGQCGRDQICWEPVILPTKSKDFRFISRHQLYKVTHIHIQYALPHSFHHVR